MDDRRTAPPQRPGPAPTPSTSAGPDRTTVDAVRRLEAWTAAGLAAGAGAIHLAAAPGHVEELGDLGLAFYWAALFQVGLAIVLRHAADLPTDRMGRHRRLGRPHPGVGPQPDGRPADRSRRTPRPSASRMASRSGCRSPSWPSSAVDSPASTCGSSGPERAMAVRSLATTSLVAVLSVIVLSSTIGVRDAVAGHSHAGSGAADHETPASMPAGMDHPMRRPDLGPLAVTRRGA